MSVYSQIAERRNEFFADLDRPLAARELRSADSAQEPSGASGPSVSIEVADSARFAELGAEWRDLASRAAEPNVFMEPAFVEAAERAGAAGGVRVLLAWSQPAEGIALRLLGVWAFVVGWVTSGLPIPVLLAPVHELAFLATPVVDGTYAAAVFTAMLDTIAAESTLPNLIMLTEMGDGGAAMAALCGALEARGSPPAFYRRTERPALRSDLDGKSYFAHSVSAGSRNKLRRRRRRLASHGVVTTTTHRSPEEVASALEEFLALEASGWKGQRGTALLCDPRQTAFARDFVNGLAASGRAMVMALRVDGRPVAARIVLRSGAGAFTWKSAYDESFADYSPGILLLEEFMDGALADPDVAFVDSCNFSGESYMADFWTERQGIADLLFDARRGGSLAFVATATSEHAYRRARGGVKAAYLGAQLRSRRMAHRLRSASAASRVVMAALALYQSWAE